MAQGLLLMNFPVMVHLIGEKRQSSCQEKPSLHFFLKPPETGMLFNADRGLQVMKMVSLRRDSLQHVKSNDV